MLLLLVSAAFLVIFSHYLWIWTYWRRRGVPGPMGYPVLGVIRDSLSNEFPLVLKFKEWTRKYGSVYGITEGTLKTLVISDPELIQEVFVTQYDNFYGRKRNPIQGDSEKEKRTNLFAAQGHRWKRLRTISSPTFSNNSLRKVTETVEECAVELMRHIEQRRGEIDMLTFYQEYTLEVIGRIAMGQTDCRMFRNPVLPLVRQIFQGHFNALFLIGAVVPWLAEPIRTVLLKRARVGAFRKISDSMKVALEERIRRREDDVANGIELGEPLDFIDLFLDARAGEVEHFGEENVDFTKSSGNSNRQLTTDEIVSNLTVFLIAGFDTTALSLSFCTHLLATNRDVQTRVQMEIDAVCGDPSISFDQLARLKYLDQVVKETLRLYPLGTFANSRKCMRATKLGGVEVEVGTMIQADTWSLHTNTDIWGDDANEFRPERWAEGTLQERQRASFISFGSGPRQCIGMRLAYMEEKMLLAHILRKYTFETGKKTQIPMKLVGSATTQPESVWMRLTPRYV